MVLGSVGMCKGLSVHQSPDMGRKGGIGHVTLVTSAGHGSGPGSRVVLTTLG